MACSGAFQNVIRGYEQHYFLKTSFMYIYRVCRNVGVPCYLHNFCVDMCAKLTWFGKVDKAISALY